MKQDWEPAAQTPEKRIGGSEIGLVFAFTAHYSVKTTSASLCIPQEIGGREAEFCSITVILGSNRPRWPTSAGYQDRRNRSPPNHAIQIKTRLPASGALALPSGPSLDCGSTAGIS
jgi:hypothetical protein